MTTPSQKKAKQGTAARNAPRRIARQQRPEPASTNEVDVSSIESSRSKKGQIIAAAIKVFLEQGYAATTLLAVAEEADVIRATIYSHFADKEQLFKAIIEELTIQRSGENFEQKALSSEPREFVYLLRDFVKGRKQDKQYLALLRTVIGESERFPELARLYFKTVYNNGMSIAQRYFENRTDMDNKDPQAMTAIVAGSLMAHLIQQELLRGKEIVPMDIDVLADTIADLITKTR